MLSKPNLVKIPLSPIPKGKVQRESSEHSLISEDKQYLVKINGDWCAGRFTREWYGWSFDSWGESGIQLDSIKGPVYEIKE